MDKNYEPQQLEGKWYQAWEKHGYFSHRASGPSYCIMLPPPNVTGSLHMGHGFQQTLMDALIRYHRMCGDNTLWQVGTDHAGISTQIVVERQLEAEKLTRQDLGREAFLDRVWQWKETSGNRITQQMRRLGTSVDWSRERFTMDEGLTSAVQKVFVRLYEEGLIYRGTRLVNWDPVLQSAISDLEVVSEEEAGTLWHLKYPFVDGSGHLIVATTRPETMLGDVAVAVHPDDERYQHAIGKEVELPLTGRRIPVVSDDMVVPDFGSGCVKITPAHDFRDYELGKRHDLPMINIFTKTAHLNDQAPQAYRGLERYEARKKILADLEALNLVEKTEAYSLMVPRGEKSQVVIEPFLTEQWFVKIAPLAEPAIKAVESGEIRFIPETWSKTYFQWMHNIEDWCISRQLWWGHRIPAWYDDAGKIYVAENEFQVREKYKLAANVRLHQDSDVLDTWFSSALWPFSTLGWPEKTPELKAFYPTSVLVTGFDIIFFWVARMIMMGLKFTNKVPFKEVYITGLIRDAEGHKMSKSKGNVLDPLDIIDGITLDALVEKRTNHLLLASQKSGIEKQTRHEFPDGISSYGTDALRFTFCALASQGRNIRFDLKRVDGYRNFCNKLWNAARYVVMNTEGDGDDPGDLPIAFSPADHWIRSKLQKTIAESHKHFQQYRFDLLANELYDFVWHEYCDWYLELSKPVLYGQEVKANLKRGAKVTLLSVLETCLRLLHPLMPFITEEIWQKISKLAGIEGETLMLRPYPMTHLDDVDPQVEREFEWIKTVIVGVRTIRSEMNVAPGKRIEILFNKGSADDHFYIEKHRELLMNLAKADSLSILAGEKPPLCATALAGECEILIPLGNLIDKAAESERLTREIGKLEKELLKTTTKLGNPAFTEKAPLEVVEKEQGRAAEMQSAIEKLQGQLEALR